LKQIFDHLLETAGAKFTESGKISLRVCACEITVEDTGIGIDAAHQEIIFDGFRQVDDEANRRYDGRRSASICCASGPPGLALPLASRALWALACVSGFGYPIED
jgi:signal transduction histidine kinase